MFSIKDPKDLMSKIDEAMNVELSNVVTVLPFLKEILLKEMLWGMFFKEEPYLLNPKKEDQIFNFSFSLVNQAQAEMKQKAFGYTEELFVPNVVPSLNGMQISVDLDWEDAQTKIIAQKDNNQCVLQKDLEVILALTLPDSSIVFESLVKGNLFDSGNANKWLYEHMDQYDEWRYEVMEELYNFFIQIGGHGRWIQSDYNESYVGQINNDIGDAGSVFIEIRDNKFNSEVDMH